MPYVAQWGDFGIMEGITNSDYQAAELNESFPYVNLERLHHLSLNFSVRQMNQERWLNIFLKTSLTSRRLLKPFYWKYPMFKWVSFKELRNLSKEDFAKGIA